MKTCLDCRRHLLSLEPRCPFCGASLPTTTGRPVLGLALGAAVSACGPSVATPDGESTAEGTTSTTSTVTSTTVTTTPATTTTTTSATGTTSIGTDSSTGYDDGWDSCGGFYGSWCFDIGPDDYECDLDLQDCPVAEKCMPWANDGGNTWNASRCSPVDPDPAQLGEPCRVEGSGVSGVDDCDAGLWCFGVDAALNEGYCVEICTNDAACSEADTACMYPTGEMPGACLLPCDPLNPMCAEHEGCYPYATSSFGCTPDGSGDFGAYGDPCIWQTDCDPGSLCVVAMHVPGCTSDTCCTDYCDPTLMNTCPDAGLGQSCTEMSNDPLVGACL